MGKIYDALDDELTAFLAAQHVFFVATAPSGDGGHVNVSPKGYDTFAVLDRRTVAYLDLTGSGVETIAHLRDNGRITLMACAFADRVGAELVPLEPVCVPQAASERASVAASGATSNVRNFTLPPKLRKGHG